MHAGVQLPGMRGAILPPHTFLSTPFMLILGKGSAQAHPRSQGWSSCKAPPLACSPQCQWTPLVGRVTCNYCTCQSPHKSATAQFAHSRSPGCPSNRHRLLATAGALLRLPLPPAALRVRDTLRQRIAVLHHLAQRHTCAMLGAPQQNSLSDVEFCCKVTHTPPRPKHRAREAGHYHHWRTSARWGTGRVQCAGRQRAGQMPCAAMHRAAQRRC